MTNQRRRAAGLGLKVIKSAIDPMFEGLRAEFESMMLSPNGFHDAAEACARAWDDCTRPSETKRIAAQFERATAWLRLCGRRKTINRRANSYLLKHEAEDWWRSQCERCDNYVSNGCLLMAAIRLGFTFDRPAWRRDFPNASLNISQRRPRGNSYYS